MKKLACAGVPHRALGLPWPQPGLDDAGEDAVPADAGARDAGDRVTLVHILDGDTLDVRRVPSGPTFRIRLLGLAAPECFKANDAMGRQACNRDDEYSGLASLQTLVRLLAGSGELEVSCDVPAGAPCELDVYNRTLAYLAWNGVDLSTQMAFEGAGFSFTRYTASKRAEICRAEDAAEAARRGTWAAGTVAQALSRMSSNTQSWHASRDRLCGEAR